MKSSIGYLIPKLSALRVAALLVMAVLSSQAVWASQHATSATPNTSSNLAPASVTKLDSLTGAPDGKYGRLLASGLKVSVVTYASWASVTLNLPASIPAGKKAYVKIKAPEAEGISLDLGSLVNLLGILDAQGIVVTTSAGTASTELVKDKNNNLYLAVTSTASYNNVTVRLNFSGFTGILGVAIGTVHLDIDAISTYEDEVFTPCSAVGFAFADIDPEAKGIDISLINPLLDPQKAIDGIVSAGNYAYLQNGAVGAVSTVSETVYLGTPSPGTNQVLATISRPPSLVDLTLLNGITIETYLGSTQVSSANLGTNLLTLTLLTLFENNNLVTVSFVPGGTFDRIVIKATAAASVFTGLRVHELSSRPPIVFTGGTVTPGRVFDPVASDLFTAKTGGAISFSIQCGLPADYTYALYQVSSPGGRTMAGTLPSTVTLNPNGNFSGTPTFGQNGTYTFDVQATNQFGQSAVASFTMEIEAALPVTLVSFKALAEGPTASLSWTTSEETNSDRFDIERSQNGKNWSKIGSMNSHKESSVNQYYSFVDPSPLRGENLYRLKMVDLDGTFAYSRIEHVNFKAVALVYPNPVTSTDRLSVNVGDWSKVSLVKVVNASGKVVFEASNALLSGISARNLAAGAYVIQVTHTDGTVTSQRFVRQ
ncbi:MAG: Ig family protein [Dyadobacter sp. 50-39]|uniref:putative Ig domain-containing protein n=1 Tax=Dyadobacter sp. 50-39 TaxID=1895756 RepID=UPI0009698EF1|nr:putative Ig domain-containing protein [Dyadobacter sp. 50-39]OJV15522.1 MAG: Ig family protein [Dyadobacter sp. 50-39]